MKSISKLFKRVTVEDTIEDELYKAQMSLLKAQTMYEYYAAEVSFQAARIKRLERQLNDLKSKAAG
jgi:hypothetical protein